MTFARCGLALVVGWSIVDAGQGTAWIETWIYRHLTLPGHESVCPEQGAVMRAAFGPHFPVIQFPPVFHLIPFWLFLLAALSDFADGLAARKLNAVSAFGAFLDPVADKLLVAFALLGLCHILNWPVVLTGASITIIVRDLLITIMRSRPGIDLPVSGLAKWKTATEMAGIGGLLLAFAIPETACQLFRIDTDMNIRLVGGAAVLLSLFSTVLVVVAAGLSLHTGGTYVYLHAKRGRTRKRSHP